MQSRLAIILMSVAGTAALFGLGFLLGLGVMSTPKPEQHKQIALTTTPTKVTRAETTGGGAQNDRALTPLTPVAPGGAATAQAAPAANDQAAAKAAPQLAPPLPQQQQASVASTESTPQPVAKDQPKNELKAQEAKAAPAPVQTAKADAAPANATPVSLASRNACDIAACSRAYRSFRESDCTYQPFSGPRQICTGAPGARDATHGRDGRDAALRDDEPTSRVRVHRVGRGDELDNVAREVERMTDGRRSDDEEQPVARRYHRDFTADGEDDRIVPADTSRGGFFDEEDDQ